VTTPTPRLFQRLCDDAAVFPPGNLPLPAAVTAHGHHRVAPYAEVAGPFVLAAKDLGRLADLTRGLPPGGLQLSLTTPAPAAVAGALAAAEEVPAIQVVALEVAVPKGVEVAGVAPTLRAALGNRELPTYVELPRDTRRDPLLAQLAGSGYRAKMRTGGVRADAHPDEHELASTIHAAVRAEVAFKATAGLHHALRNTDPETGFDQHGFLNVTMAAAAAADGGSVSDLAALLAIRDASRVVAEVNALDPAVRQVFCSFGTCSIAEPVAELVALDLLPHDHLTAQLTEALP
jgi:hypothetical protein